MRAELWEAAGRCTRAGGRALRVEVGGRRRDASPTPAHRLRSSSSTCRRRPSRRGRARRRIEPRARRDVGYADVQRRADRRRELDERQRGPGQRRSAWPWSSTTTSATPATWPGQWFRRTARPGRCSYASGGRPSDLGGGRDRQPERDVRRGGAGRGHRQRVDRRLPRRASRPIARSSRRRTGRSRPAGGDADVVNASIGQDTATGAEEARRYFDSIVYEDGRLVVAASGNFTTFGNWDVVSPGTGYNVLTVGGVNDRNTGGHGPTIGSGTSPDRTEPTTTTGPTHLERARRLQQAERVGAGGERADCQRDHRRRHERREPDRRRHRGPADRPRAHARRAGPRAPARSSWPAPFNARRCRTARSTQTTKGRAQHRRSGRIGSWSTATGRTAGTAWAAMHAGRRVVQRRSRSWPGRRCGSRSPGAATRRGAEHGKADTLDRRPRPARRRAQRRRRRLRSPSTTPTRSVDIRGSADRARCGSRSARRESMRRRSRMAWRGRSPARSPMPTTSLFRADIMWAATSRRSRRDAARSATARQPSVTREEMAIASCVRAGGAAGARAPTISTDDDADPSTRPTSMPSPPLASPAAAACDRLLPAQRGDPRPDGVASFPARCNLPPTSSDFFCDDNHNHHEAPSTRWPPPASPAAARPAATARWDRHPRGRWPPSCTAGSTEPCSDACRPDGADGAACWQPAPIPPSRHRQRRRQWQRRPADRAAGRRADRRATRRTTYSPRSALPEPGHPFDAATLLASCAARGAGRSAGPARDRCGGGGLAGRNLDLDGEPWTTMAAGGSCGPRPARSRLPARAPARPARTCGCSRSRRPPERSRVTSRSSARCRPSWSIALDQLARAVGDREPRRPSCWPARAGFHRPTTGSSSSATAPAARRDRAGSTSRSMRPRPTIVSAQARQTASHSIRSGTSALSPRGCATRAARRAGPASGSASVAST